MTPDEILDLWSLEAKVDKYKIINAQLDSVEWGRLTEAAVKVSENLPPLELENLKRYLLGEYSSD